MIQKHTYIKKNIKRMVRINKRFFFFLQLFRRIFFLYPRINSELNVCEQL